MTRSGRCLLAASIVALLAGCGASSSPPVDTVSCTDGLKNGNETDVDCGGATCAACVNGKACTGASDCSSGNCSGNVCAVAVSGPPPTCSDGIKNGTETDVDCGGGCRAGCAVASACIVNADCMLGTCSSGVCVVPPGAPRPSGPVDVVLGSAGGNVQVVTPEGVSFQVAVPPGALAGDVPLRVEAQPARRGEWFRIGFNAPGLLFRLPVTVTLTIPGGNFSPDATLYAQASLPMPSGEYPRIYAPSTRSADGRTLTATVTSLGNGGLAPVSLAPGATGRLTSPLVSPSPATTPGDDAAYWNSFFLHAAAIPLDELIPVLMLMLDGLAKEGLVTEAVALASGVDALLMRLGEDQGQWSTAAHFFFTEMGKAVCTGFEFAIARMDTLSSEMAKLAKGEPPTTDPAPVPICTWRIRESVKEMGLLGALENKVEAVSHGNCPAASSWGAHVALLADKAHTYMERSPHFDRLAFNACTCRDPKRLKAEATGRVRIRPWCVNAPPIPGVRAPQALAPTFDATTEPAEWEVLLGTVEDSLDAFAALYAVGDVAEGQLLDKTVGVDFITTVRARAYALCTENQDSSILSTLSKRVGALDAPRSDLAAPILLDAQRCGAALHLVAEHSGHTTSTTSDVPFPTAAGQAPTVSPVSADGDGWLQISGPIATLRCRDDDPYSASRLEEDELTFTSVAGANRSPIGTRFANSSKNVLDTAYLPFPVDIHTQLIALGLPTDKDASFNVLIERKGPGCGVQPPSTTLFTVPVRVKPTKIAFVYLSGIYVVNPDGSGLKQLVARGDLPSWSHDHAKLAFVNDTFGISVINADGTGRVEIPPASGAGSSSEPSLSYDGTRVAFLQNGPVDSLCVMKVDGTELACMGYLALTDNSNGWGGNQWDPWPTWAPDGSQLAYVGKTWNNPGPPTDPHMVNDIYAVSPGSSAKVNLTNLTGTGSLGAEGPAWSPDGTRIVFVLKDGTGGTDIYTMDKGGGGRTRLTSDRLSEHPSWSPDGSRIVFARYVIGSGYSLFIMNADGSGETDLHTPGYAPAW